MENNFYTNLIENYLTGKISSGDQRLLEMELAKDPLLKQEIDLQNDILNSIKNNRKVELKSRLNKINIPAANPVFSTIKVAASLLVGSMVGMGIYLYISKDTLPDSLNASIASETKKEIVYNETTSEQINNTDILSESQEKLTEKAEVELSQKPTIVTKETTDKSSTSKKKKNAGSISIIEAETLASASDFAPVSFNDIEDLDKSVKLPDGEIAKSTEKNLSNLEITVESGSKEKFHYKYFNNKLFLYGTFNSDPYEILELNSSKQKQLYLYFNGHYHALKDNQTKVSPLVEIKDLQVINELNILKNK